MPSLGGFKLAEFLGKLGVLDNEGVAGGRRFDHRGFGQGEIDVFGGAHAARARAQLRDEGGLSIQRLPAIGIEAAAGDITEDLNFLVLVPLP